MSPVHGDERTRAFLSEHTSTVITFPRPSAGVTSRVRRAGRGRRWPRPQRRHTKDRPAATRAAEPCVTELNTPGGNGLQPASRVRIWVRSAPPRAAMGPERYCSIIGCCTPPRGPGLPLSLQAPPLPPWTPAHPAMDGKAQRSLGLFTAGFILCESPPLPPLEKTVIMTDIL